MKLFFVTLLAAFAAGDDGESYIEEQLSKIKSIDAPFTTKRPPVEGSGSISWKTRTFSDKQENFVLVRSQTEYCDDIQLISMMRFNGKTKMWTETIIDDAYAKRASIKNQGGNTFQVTVSDVTKNDRWFYVLYSTNDPFDGVIIEVDDYMYQANIYNGKVGAKYHKMGDDWLLFGYQEATEAVTDLKISNGVPFTAATAAQKSSAGIPDSVSAIVAKRPSDDWFSTNRALDTLTVSTGFSSETVLRFFDLADAKSEISPVLVGWEVTIKCGPIPPSADEVEVFSRGKKMETTIMGREHISASTIGADGYIRLAKVKATEEMDAKVGAVSCRFYSSDDRILGMSKPTSYAVHSAESPRPNFEAQYKLPNCGLDVASNAQEVAYCQVPDGEKSSVFPPVQLQWEITRSDGTKFTYPEVPKETMYLALSVKIDESLRGAKATCLDWRSGDPSQPATYSVTEPGRTLPSNSGTGISVRQYTQNVVINIKNNDVTCTSDVFGTQTAAENECSDVQKWNEADTTICPYTKTFGNVTCSAEMTNGETKTQNYDNKDCIENLDDITEIINGLGMGSIIAIVVGILGVIALIVALFCWCCGPKASASYEVKNDPETVVIRPNRSIYETNPPKVEQQEEHVLLTVGEENEARENQITDLNSSFLSHQNEDIQNIDHEVVDIFNSTGTTGSQTGSPTPSKVI